MNCEGEQGTVFETVVMKDISCGLILYKEKIFVANLQNRPSKLKSLGGCR